MDYPKFFDLEGLEGKPRQALVAAYDLAEVNNGDFLEKCASAIRNNSNREARECVRAALALGGWPHSEAQAIAGGVLFAEMV